MTKAVIEGLSDIWGDTCFCEVCNFAMSKVERRALVCNVRCPRCGLSRVSDFYDYGSQVHKSMWERYVSGAEVSENMKYKFSPPLAYNSKESK